MSERKVLNKYYPPDFDPTKIPKIKRPKNYRKGVFSIRLMAPFNMRCNTCGEYIYKGKKFNSRKETVENENYLGLHIFRFYIKCPRCIAEIAFKTDPESTDYVLEAGATRNFEATRTAEKMALQEQKEKEAEEANNPMKVLENRTKASCQEMEMLETLEELRELRQKHAKVDTEMMLQQNLEEAKRHREEIQRQQEEEDEQFVRSIFGSDGTGIVVKRLQSDSEESSGSDASETEEPKAKVSCLLAEKPTDILTQNGSSTSSTAPKLQPSWSRSVGSMSSKALLAGLVKPKATSKVDANATTGGQTKQPVGPLSSSSSAGRLADRSDAEVSGSTGTSAVKASPSNSVASSAVPAAKSSALAGLGAYSDSSEVDE